MFNYIPNRRQPFLLQNSWTNLMFILVLVLPVIHSSTANAQSNSKNGTYNVSRYEPSGNGYVVENVKIKHGIAVHQQGTQYAKIQWGIDEVSSEVVGYKYNGQIYTNSSEICEPSMVCSDLEDIRFSELKASWQIIYRGNVFKVMDNVSVSGPVQAFGSAEIDAESDINDYSIANLRISSTNSSQNNSKIERAIQTYQQKIKEEKAQAQQAQKVAQSGPVSGSPNTGSASFSNASNNERFSLAANSGSDTNGSNDVDGEEATQETFSITNSGSSTPSSANSTFRRDREREAEADVNRRYQAARQEHETSMAVLQGAQQDFTNAMESFRKANQERYARKEAEQSRWVSQQIQNRERFTGIMEEFLDRRRDLKSIREEYIQWLREQISKDPSVYYINSIIDQESLSEDDAFYMALIEIRWKEGGRENAPRMKEFAGNPVYDYRRPLRDTKNGYYDAVVRTDGETKLLRANPITRDHLPDITGDFWESAIENQNPMRFGPNSNRIFIIASTSRDKLLDFTDRIKPVDVFGMQHTSYPAWDLWDKFNKAAGSYPLNATKAEIARYVEAKRINEILERSPDPMAAIENGDSEALSIHLGRGADVTVRDVEGNTLLHKAGNAETARLLIDHGADVNALGLLAMTPLHKAAMKGDIALVRLLLEAGANANAKNLQMESKPSSYVQNNELSQLLSEYEAKQADPAPPVTLIPDQNPGCTMTTSLQYPEEVRQKSIGGAVKVSVILGEDGEIIVAGVLPGLGIHPLLDKEAVRVAKALSCTPAQKGGRAVKSTVTLPVQFKIK